ncbi:hypothetical protein [Sphaerisporangium aureirubrum]|uniref:Ferredoxin-NADPH reductase n=1 Tax=Sphaerisporangium aureirubrum TaxID=1544736 RepID=A0ABW1NF65_9ACTN
MRGLLRPARQATYESLFGTVYTALLTNVLLALTCAPLLAALAVVRDPLASWPFFAVLSLPCAPALTGAFACFATLGEAPPAGVARTFWRAYRRSAPRALATWTAGTAIVAVLVLDAVIVSRTPWGPALVPFFATAAVLTVATVLALLVLASEPRPGRSPDVRPGRSHGTVLPCLYLVARRWYLAPVVVAVLGLTAAVVLAKPLIGLLLACSPLLYAAWATTRFIVAPLLPDGAPA